MKARRRDNFLGLPMAVLAFASCHKKDAVVPPQAHGLLPFYWDGVSIINHGFSIFYRLNNTVLDQQVLDALIQVRNKERYIELRMRNTKKFFCI
ncbi:hypothetical protein [Terrimonas pollutisoli]|uniref:hypothetical protein n=1 Tax=Terrimonas pollutisoli TaxID=3034147 RepID=UPI0023EE0E0F|nr:hypothetical protein [Terrimonas sp. H1YJ31]